MAVEIEVVEDPARAASALMVSAALGGGQIVLAGGSTPKAAYGEFVKTVREVGLDLSATTFWFGDERCVGPADERSNYLMVKDSLLDPLADLGQVPTVRRMEGELGPWDGAAAYEQALDAAGRPEFDLVLLGIGPDCHTASLFPDQPALSERDRYAVGVEMSGLEPFVPRITLSFTGLAAAKRIAFLISGESKAEAVANAFGPDARPDPHFPSSLLPPLAKELTVLLDAPAAAKL
jgi:6-phosphogluconolactonase